MTATLPSLLESLDMPTARQSRTPLWRRARAVLLDRWSRYSADPARLHRTILAARVIGAVLLVGSGAGAYFLIRPVPKPDYMADDVDAVLGYTLLTDEFNRLPVEERLRLIGQLVQRFKSLDTTQSVLLANFAAGIAGTARDQLMENASRLALDTWDKYALDYSTVPSSDQEQYLDNSFVEFTKLMENLGGRVRDVSDEERLAEGRRQAKRDMDTMRDPDKTPSNESVGRLLRFVNNDVGQHASPQQRVRGQQMMRDMTRRLRGQDISTGKPK